MEPEAEGEEDSDWGLVAVVLCPPSGSKGITEEHGKDTGGT